MTADTLYSGTLLLAMLTASGAALVALLSLRRAPLHRAVRLLGLWSGSLSVASLVTSLSVHLAFGHRPGTAEALAFFEFFRIHPSYPLLALLAAASLWRLARTNPEV